MATKPTPAQVLATPMEGNDAGADTIRDYLIALLAELWAAGEDFGGKRPFGNSGWKYDLYHPLIKAGYITGRFDQWGYIEEVDGVTAWKLIRDAIQALQAPAAEEAPDA